MEFLGSLRHRDFSYFEMLWSRKDNEKLKVFTPFYRINNTNKSNNIGLGLAITKEIISGHHGTITLKNSNNLGGLLVQITLPIIVDK